MYIITDFIIICWGGVWGRLGEECDGDWWRSVVEVGEESGGGGGRNVGLVGWSVRRVVEECEEGCGGKSVVEG